MRFTEEELEDLCRKTCPHCGAGIAVRKRADTNEWVHDSVMTSRGVMNGHSICWGSGLRVAFTTENSVTGGAPAGESL